MPVPAGEADRRTASLAILTTGVAGRDVCERLAWALIDQAAGRPAERFECSSTDFDAILELAMQHRVLLASASIVPALADRSVEHLARVIAIERAMLDATDLLDTAGVESLVLKGNATGRLDYPNPGRRAVGDVDLLVRLKQFERATRALTAAGYRSVPTHPFGRSSFFHSETLVRPDGIEIDLHHRLAQPSRTPISCWVDPEPFQLGGRTLFAMSRPWRFTHALVHQLKDAPPTTRALSGLLDLVVMWTQGVDLDEVRRASREIDVATLVERGLHRITDLLGDEAPPPTRQSVSSWSERRLAAALDSTRAVPGYLTLAANLRVQPVRLWPSYVRQLVWPTVEYRQALGITLGGQIRHVVREALGR